VGYALVAVGVLRGVTAGRAAAGPAAPTATATAGEAEGKLARLVDAVDRRQRRSRPLGFLFAVLKKFGEDGAGRLAALIAYYGFFSVFPLTMALSAILGLVLENDESLREDIQDRVAAQVPFVGDQLSQGTLEGSGLALFVGIALALWAGLAAIDAVQNALNSVWHVPRYQRPKVLGRRVRSVVMLGVVGLGLLAATVGTSVLNAAPLGALSGVGLAVAAVAVNVGLFLVSFKVLCDRPLPWGALWPGALIAGGATWLLQNGFASFLLRDTGEAQGTYGDFASVIVLLSYFFLLAQVTIFGAEVNVVRHEGLHPRSLSNRHLTPADERALVAYARVEARLEGQRVEVALPAAPPAAGGRPTADRRAP
jgi:YihY family inner membrane protein